MISFAGRARPQPKKMTLETNLKSGHSSTYAEVALVGVDVVLPEKRIRVVVGVLGENPVAATTFHEQAAEDDDRRDDGPRN